MTSRNVKSNLNIRSTLTFFVNHFVQLFVFFRSVDESNEMKLKMIEKLHLEVLCNAQNQCPNFCPQHWRNIFLCFLKRKKKLTARIRRVPSYKSKAKQQKKKVPAKFDFSFQGNEQSIDERDVLSFFDTPRRVLFRPNFEYLIDFYISFNMSISNIVHGSNYRTPQSCTLLFVTCSLLKFQIFSLIYQQRYK